MAYPPLRSSSYLSLAAMYAGGAYVPTSIEDIYAWYRALRDIAGAAGGTGDAQFPRGNFYWYSGTVGSITANGDGSYNLEDGGATYPTSLAKCGKPTAYSTFYVAILYEDDPRSIVKAPIMAKVDGQNLQLSGDPFSQFQGGLADAVARGFCTSLGDLSGCAYRVYYGGDISDYDQWADPPNDIEFVSNPTYANNGQSGSTAIMPTSLVEVSTAVTSGTYQLVISGTGASGTTAAINYDAKPIDIQNAITAVIGGSNAVAAGYQGGAAVAFDTNLLPVTLTVTGSTLVGGSATVSGLSQVLIDTTQKWRSSQWITPQADWPGAPTSFDLMVYNNGAHGDSNVYRLSITANGGTDITTGSIGTLKPSLNFYYSIVGSGGWWSPQNTGCPSFAAYTGALDTRYSLSHFPDDSIQAYPVPALDVSFDPGDTLGGGDCMGDESYIVLNKYVINDCCDIGCCSDPNKIYNPNLYKSWRAIQQALIDSCGNPWIDPAWPGSTPHCRPNPMVFPIAAGLAGVNAVSFSIGSLSSDKSKAYIGISLPYPDPIFWYCTFYPTPADLPPTSGAIDANGVCTLGKDDTGVYIPGSWNDSQVGETGQGTFGFESPFHYGLLYLTRKTTWMPSEKEDSAGDGVEVVDPPEVSGGPNPKPDIGAYVTAQNAGAPTISLTINVQKNQSALAVFATTANVNDPGSGAISDSQGQSWTYGGFIAPDSTDAGANAFYYVAEAAIGSTTITFTPSTADTTLTLTAVEITGAGGSTPVDVSASQGASGSTSASAGNLTTTYDDDLILSFSAAAQNPGSWSVSSGSTMIDSTIDTTVSARAISYIKVPTAGTSEPTGFTLSNYVPNTNWAIAWARGLQTAYLGYILDRPASTNYVRFDNDYGRPSETGPTYTTNDLAEFLGDNSCYPTLYGYDSANPGPYPKYKDYQYVGINGPNPTNPAFIGRILDPTTGRYTPTDIDAQGHGTAMMRGTVASYANGGGLTIQISTHATAGNNWWQKWYSTADQISQVVSGTVATGGANSLTVASDLFTAKLWGLTCTVTHTDSTTSPPTITTTDWTINGAGLTPHVLHFVAQTGKSIAAGDTYSIIVPGCVLYTHEITAASGSATSFIATDSPGDIRFAPGIYDKGYTLRVYHDNGDGTQKLTKFFITATVQSSGELTLIGPDSATIAGGDAAEIRWPQYEVNPMQELTCTFAAPTGFSFGGQPHIDVKIKGDDENTLFIDSPPSGFVITDDMLAAGVSFQINTMLPGSVLRYTSAGAWEIPTGTDPRTDPVGGFQPDFCKDPRGNEPFNFQWKGLIHVGTIPVKEIWEQMFDIAKQFKKQDGGADWTSRQDGVTPELNYITAGAGYQDAFCDGPCCDDSYCNYPTDRFGCMDQVQGEILTALGSPFTVYGGGTGAIASFSDAPPNCLSGTANKAEHDLQAPYKNSTQGFGQEEYTNDNEEYCGTDHSCDGTIDGGAGGGTADIAFAQYAYAVVTGLTNPYIAGSINFANYAEWDVTDPVTTDNSDYSDPDFPPGSCLNPYRSSTIGPNKFTSSGDDVVQKTWTIWDTESVNPTRIVSTKLGSLTVIDLPNYPAIDPDLPAHNYYTGGSAQWGYNVTDLLYTAPFFLPAVGA